MLEGHATLSQHLGTDLLTRPKTPKSNVPKQLMIRVVRLGESGCTGNPQPQASMRISQVPRHYEPEALKPKPALVLRRLYNPPTFVETSSRTLKLEPQPSKATVLPRHSRLQHLVGLGPRSRGFYLEKPLPARF